MPLHDHTNYDGVMVPKPKSTETKAFAEWIQQNEVKDAMMPEAHYDYVSAFREGVMRDKNGHFPDRYKTPGHPTFSIESKYYKPGMKAGMWQKGKYVPLEGD